MIVDTRNVQGFDVEPGLFAASPLPSSCVGGDHCIMEGTLPSGIVILLHTHPDPESLYVLDGEIELYLDDGTTSGWRKVRASELAVLPGSTSTLGGTTVNSHAARRHKIRFVTAFAGTV